jgi:hypothetical protein
VTVWSVGQVVAALALALVLFGGCVWAAGERVERATRAAQPAARARPATGAAPMARPPRADEDRVVRCEGVYGCGMVHGEAGPWCLTPGSGGDHSWSMVAAVPEDSDAAP